MTRWIDVSAAHGRITPLYRKRDVHDVSEVDDTRRRSGRVLYRGVRWIAYEYLSPGFMSSGWMLMRPEEEQSQCNGS